MTTPPLSSALGPAPALSVGVMAANWLALGEDVARLERSEARLLHFDVMDGRFVPQLTLGPAVVGAVKTALLKDVHLMIEEPLASLGEYVAAGADLITVHAEAGWEAHRALQVLGATAHAGDPERGLWRGVALNPGTPLETLEPLLERVDLVMLLAINPGWGGQQFLPATRARAAQVRRMIAASGREILLGVDGGVTQKNLAEVGALGADLVVTGSAVFSGGEPAANVATMLQGLRGAPRDPS
jgi:ribulose-phosphate 3-epimerase